MNKIASIQVLRAIASIMVLIRHSQSQLSGYEIKYGLEPSFLNSIDPRQLGAAGVDIFFVISGLVMALVTYTPRRGFAEILPFLRKRVVRIIPPYWLWTGILIALLLLLPSDLRQTKPDPDRQNQQHASRTAQGHAVRGDERSFRRRHHRLGQ